MQWTAWITLTWIWLTIKDLIVWELSKVLNRFSNLPFLMSCTKKYFWYEFVSTSFQEHWFTSIITDYGHRDLEETKQQHYLFSNQNKQSLNKMRIFQCLIKWRKKIKGIVKSTLLYLVSLNRSFSVLWSLNSIILVLMWSFPKAFRFCFCLQNHNIEFCFS